MRRNVMLCLAFLFIAQNLTFAMDYPEGNSKTAYTVSEAIDLLKASYGEEVTLYDGCCCIKDRECCSDNKKCCCSCPVGFLSIKNFLVGVGTFISGTVCTSVGYENPSEHPMLIIAGPILLGIWGYSLLSTPVYIVGVNFVRKIIADRENAQIDEKLQTIASIPNFKGRLSEEFVTLIAEHIIKNKNSHKKLDAEQLCALSEHPEFESLLGAKAFNDKASSIAITYLKLKRSPLAELKNLIGLSQTQAMFKEYPSIADRLNELYPHTLAIDVNAALINKYSIKKITNDDFSSDLNGKELKVAINDEIVYLTKTEWKQISETIYDIFIDIDSSNSSSITVDPIENFSIGTEEQRGMLLSFIKMPAQEREKIVITKSNKDQLMKMDKLYGIPFLHKKFDKYFSLHGIPVQDFNGRLQFAQNNKLSETKNLLITQLQEKLSRLAFDDEDFACLSNLNEDDQKAFYKNFYWEEFDKGMKDPELLRRYWGKANQLNITQIKNKIIDFGKDTNYDVTMANAWTILPDEIYEEVAR